MKKNGKIIALTAVLALCLLLTGCYVPPDDVNNDGSQTVNKPRFDVYSPVPVNPTTAAPNGIAPDETQAAVNPGSAQNTIARTQSFINELGKQDTKRVYERCKTLNLDSAGRDQIASQSIEKYGPVQNPIYVTEYDRLPMDDEIWKAIEADNKKTTEEDEGRQLYLGTPLGMEEYAKVRVFVHRSGENLCAVIPDLGMLSSLLFCTISSLLLSSEREICILADAYDPAFRQCRNSLRKLQETHSNLQIYTETSDICEKISSLMEELKKRKKQSRFDSGIHLLWLGFDEILKEMSHYSDHKPVGMDGSKEKSLDDMLSDLEASFRCLNLVDSDTGAATPSPAFVQQSKPEADSEDEEFLYNAAEDIRQLGLEGPKRDIHQYLFCSDAKSACRQRTIKTEDCRHKVTAGISKEDATDFLGSSKYILDANGKLLGEQIAVYFDGRSSQTFNPYIYEQVEVMHKKAQL